MAAVDNQAKIDFYLKKIEAVPSLPMVVLKLIKLIDNPMTSLRQIEESMELDQGLTLKVLRIANTAFYAVPGGVKTIKRALVYLGLNTVKQIVIASSVVEQFKLLNSDTFNLADFWKHSIGVGLVAEALAKQIKIVAPEEVFVCGLVHDMGKLALLLIDKDEFQKTCVFAKENNLTLHQAEIKREVPKHSYWGFVLAKKWQLPLLIQSAIKDHHTHNHKMRVTQDNEMNQMVDIVFLANQIVHQFDFGNSGYLAKENYNEEILKRLGLDSKINEEWNKKIEESLIHAESLVKLFTE